MFLSGRIFANNMPAMDTTHILLSVAFVVPFNNIALPLVSIRIELANLLGSIVKAIIHFTPVLLREDSWKCRPMCARDRWKASCFIHLIVSPSIYLIQPQFEKKILSNFFC